MTIALPLANPVSMWDEHPLQFAAGVLTTLVPWKRTDGFWVLLPAGTPGPTGAVRGAWTHATFDTLSTSTLVGLRHTRNPSGFIFSY